jgi:hypothetical protein
MIFNATEDHNAQVSEYFRMMLRSAVEVDRPLTPNDTQWRLCSARYAKL